MKVCYRDSKDVKWRRGGTKISYQQSSDESCYELRFTHFFKTNEYSCVEFAFSFPYGYKRLQDFVMHLDRKVRCGSLGQSFDGREIPLLTVGNPDSPKVIILSARVHPGEAVSSFIMEGFLK